MTTYKIVAATGCPTGIAHTYMAQEALEQAAKRKGVSIKVETHGQVGIENELTPEEIKNADAVIIAADKDVQAERFAGKRVSKMRWLVKVQSLQKTKQLTLLVRKRRWGLQQALVTVFIKIS